MLHLARVKAVGLERCEVSDFAAGKGPIAGSVYPGDSRYEAMDLLRAEDVVDALRPVDMVVSWFFDTWKAKGLHSDIIVNAANLCIRVVGSLSESCG